MNKLKLFFILMLTTHQVLAQFTSSSRIGARSTNNIRYSNKIHFGIEAGSWEYVEVDSKSKDRLMTDSGNLYGLTFKSNHELAPQFVFLTKARLLGGKTNYDGYLQDKEGAIVSPYKADTHNFLGSAHLALGYNLSSNENFALTPNIGIYRRMLLNPQQNSDPYDYTRRAIYGTFPLAIDMFYKIDQDMALSLSATSHLSFQGETMAYASGNDGGNRRYQQEKGKGQEFLIGSEFKLAGNNIASINLHYKTWEIEDSKKEYESETIYSLEPKNSTKEVGINVGMTF